MEMKKPKLLIVDDDPVSGKMLEMQLEKKGLEITRLTDGNTCLQVLSEKNEFDLILLDIMLPEINGIEVLEEIRKNKNASELPVIMVTTAKSEDSDIIEALKKGANDYLVKPVNIEITLARIRTQIKVKNLFQERLSLKKASTISSMIGTLNHEINNPLAIAVGNISVLQKLMKDDPNLPKIDKVSTALDRVTELVKKMKEISISSKELEMVKYASDQDIFKI